MTADEAKDRLYDTTFLFGALRRRAAIKALAEVPDSSGVIALAQALQEGHPQDGRIRSVLRQLSPLRDEKKIAALWAEWAQAPGPGLASILSALGWPLGGSLEARFVRAVLAAATSAAAPEVLQAVAILARALPVKDESLNDGIYAAWIRSQSAELEKLIDEQARQASSPALEALHALVTGRLERYAELKDADGMLLVHAFGMAPEPFRARIARTVGANPDRRLLENYRRALSSVTTDAARNVENLKLVGDEDGLFEVTRSLRLLDVLDLCERWSASAGRPTGTQQRAAVERALAAHRTLGTFKVEDSPPLPDGLVDVFEWWRNVKPSDAQLRSDLDAPDPFQNRTRSFVPISTRPTHSRKPAASTSGASAGWWMMRACVRRPRATTGRSGWWPACWNPISSPKRSRITCSGSTRARAMLPCCTRRSRARRKTTRVTPRFSVRRAARSGRVRARF